MTTASHTLDRYTAKHLISKATYCVLATQEHGTVHAGHARNTSTEQAHREELARLVGGDWEAKFAAEFIKPEAVTNGFITRFPASMLVG